MKDNATTNVALADEFSDADADYFGLEMQFPWSRHLLEGRKTMEVRTYPLPLGLRGRKIYILESPQGKDGVTGLGDRIELQPRGNGNDNYNNDESPSLPSIVGWCIFDVQHKEYLTEESFSADEDQHLVSAASGYAWKEGRTSTLYGWVVQEHRSFIFANNTNTAAEATTINTKKSGNKAEESDGTSDFVLAVRRKRSLFQLYRNAHYDDPKEE